MNDEPRGPWRRRLLARLGPSWRRPPSEGHRDERLRALEARVDHLEAALQGLQDSTHRLFVQHNERLDDLNQRTQPRQLARALSRDARSRGL